MNSKNFFWSSFLVFAFTIPLSQFISVRILVCLTIVAAFMIRDIGTHVFMLKNSWDLLLYGCVLAVGLIYSEDLSTGLSVMESNFSFLAIPFVISRCPQIDKERLDQVLRAFRLGLIVASVICILVAVRNYFQHHDIKFFFFYDFTDVIDSHPTYFAYFIIFSITIELFKLYSLPTGIKLAERVLIILFLFGILILTGGQTAFIAVLFVFSFFILKFLMEDKTYQGKVNTGLITLMLLALFSVSQAEKQFLRIDFKDSWERIVLWESAISAIPNPLLGVGTGDSRAALHDYFSDHGLTRFAAENFNSHNQVIQILFSNGVFGLAFFLIISIRPLVTAVQNRNVLVILCFFPFLVYGMTEAFLGRYQGIVFFVLLHQVFCASMRLEESISIN